MHRNPDWGINEAILSCQNRYKYLIALLKTNPEQLCISDFFPHPKRRARDPLDWHFGSRYTAFSLRGCFWIWLLERCGDSRKRGFNPSSLHPHLVPMDDQIDVGLERV
jgi:hypothetical protein